MGGFSLRRDGMEMEKRNAEQAITPPGGCAETG
jgi:hypothetical protein